jgi:hypothetical protein
MRSSAFAYLALPVALLLVWFAYAPGLSGTFLFDDFNNLQFLGAYGTIDSWKKLAFYVTSGIADPTGRPLSLLSFLADSNTWPTTPAPFKRDNLLLHLLNGVLLCWTLLRLGRRCGVEEYRAQRAAVVGAGLWALHPLLVSTTLYVVQREAMLPATFILAGILLWDGGEARLLEGKRGGLPLMVCGAWVCTLLALLSKANGILLPLLILVIQWTLPRHDRGDSGRQHVLRRYQTILIGLPSAALFVWLVYGIPSDIANAAANRPWTLGERLMTEGRVVTDYLRLLWLPRASLSGLFHDGYKVSTGLLDPVSTLPAIAFLVGLLGIAVAMRRHRPATALAIVFFFAGHLLESTVIPLELYFEHRNYVPALLMFWPLALWLTGDGALPSLRSALIVALPALLALLTYFRASLWGAPYDQAELWAKLSPNSPRAQANAAAYELAHGRSDLAAVRLRHAIATISNQNQLTLNLIDAECDTGSLAAGTLDLAKVALLQSPPQGEFVTNWFISAIPLAAARRCAGFDLSALETLIDAAKQNPKLSAGPHEVDIDRVVGQLALASHRGQDALYAFNAALRLRPTPDLALSQAALLGRSGYPGLGAEHLEYFKTLKAHWPKENGMAALHRWILLRCGYWQADLIRIEAQLREDAKRQRHRSAANSAAKT